MKRIAVINFFFIVFSLAFLPFHAHAQSALSIGVFPPVIEVNADPPAEVRSGIVVQNLSEEAQILDITFKPFKLSASRDGQIEFLKAGDISMPTGLILEKVKILEAEKAVTQVELAPFESKELSLAFDIDEKDPLGDYYFSVLFISKEGNENPGSGSFAQGGIGINVILTIGEKGEVKGQILDFSAPFINTSGPLPISLLLKNDSQHYITPTGNVIIKNMFGKEVGKLTLLPQYILAGAERYMRDQAQASPSADLENTMLELSQDHPKLIWTEEFLLGLYTAEARIKLAENGPLFVTTTTFFAIPLYIVFAVSLFTFVLLGIWIRVKKKMNQKISN